MNDKQYLTKRYKEMQIHPHISDNIYMELSLRNLHNFYQIALKDLTDIRLFFNMHSETDEKRIIQNNLEHGRHLSRV